MKCAGRCGGRFGSMSCVWIGRSMTCLPSEKLLCLLGSRNEGLNEGDDMDSSACMVLACASRTVSAPILSDEFLR